MHSPGPGTYDANSNAVNSKNTYTYKFGSSKRSEMVTSKSYMDLPGPANYNNDEVNTFGKNAIKVSIKGKAKDTRDSGVPGPG
jgi:hypothetical protein